MISCPSPNFDARALPVTMAVLHYTGMPDAAAAVAWLTDRQSRVSAHYAVAEDGQVFGLVDEADRAWHAGRSWWRGVTDINSASVGIEIVNPGHEFGYRPFPTQQMDAIEVLLRSIVERHGIRPEMVVGHSDIAPARKEDPGELFDWARLARAGLAVPVPALGEDPKWTDAGFVMALGRFGYDTTEPRAATVAFQRRFRPRDWSGVVDAECRQLLYALLRQPWGAV